LTKSLLFLKDKFKHASWNRNDIKSGVIYEWLSGIPRDKIAEIYNVSSGGVSNIINEWRIRIGGYIAEDLRELSLSLKKPHLHPFNVLWDSE